MSDELLCKHPEVVLRPDAGRTVVRPFMPAYPESFAAELGVRPEVIAGRVLALGAADRKAELDRIMLSLDARHRDTDRMLLRRYDEVAEKIGVPAGLDNDCRRLIGAYFSEEYSYEAAALFNPSIGLHPDQEGVPEGSLRFVLSLRGIGEGHVSSVTFRTGTWEPGEPPVMDRPSSIAVPPIIEDGDGNDDPETVRLHCEGSRDVSETVLFPVLPRQRQGIEDLRLCRFVEDDGEVKFYGTYTAFSGAEARSELLTGIDFRTVTMHKLHGSAAAAKGMALFPRRIGGRFAAITRQDSENIWLLTSDDILHWDGGTRIVRPHYPWEIVQMGNCGSPIELDEGWLVITHGVGVVRNYSLGACLLDKADPSKLLARTPRPFLEPAPEERDGYVPNVVYSCGALVCARKMLLPYAVADSFTSFATIDIDALLASME